MTPDRRVVLVVDDDEMVRRVVRTVLQADGFEVLEASGGEHALDLLERAEPAVVVLDVRMPGMDGLETARRIKARRPNQQLIVYSAFVDEDIEQEAASIGVALCVGKVEGIEALEQEIRRLGGR